VTERAPMAERIMAAADRLFYQKGIRAVGVDTVAAEAGISKRSLYDTFPSKDALVAAYLRQQAEVAQMLGDIRHFLDAWLGALARDHRSYVTVAIGCTGGQHRSVYLVEQLADIFASQWTTLKRHRELDVA